MSYLEAFARIIVAYAWPAVIIALCCLLRSGLLNVLNRFAEHVGRLKTARITGVGHMEFNVRSEAPRPRGRVAVEPDEPKIPPLMPPIKEIEPDV